MRRTDLALEEKESIKGNQEIPGVVLEQEKMEQENTPIRMNFIGRRQSMKKKMHW